MTAVLGGHIDLTDSNLTQKSKVQAGQLKFPAGRHPARLDLFRSLMTDADPWLFLTRPISGVVLGLAALSVALGLWQHRRLARRAAAGEAVGEF